MSAASDTLAGPAARSVRFRPMIASDVPQVGELERGAYRFPWSEGIFRDCLRVGYVCRVAEHQGRIVAYGVIAFGGAGEAHLLNLCVAPELQRRNLGRQMLLLLLERAREAGMTEVFLEVRPSNAAASALYESVGFEQVGLRRAYYQAEGGREDARLLRLELPAEPIQ